MISPQNSYTKEWSKITEEFQLHILDFDHLNLVKEDCFLQIQEKLNFEQQYRLEIQQPSIAHNFIQPY